jgi:dienelactone hydrolase
MKDSDHRMSLNRCLVFALAVLPALCWAESPVPAEKKAEASDLKYETVVLKDGPAATVHILYKPGQLKRRPAILMLGPLQPENPPAWSTGLLRDGYMLVAFTVDYPLDPDPERRPKFLVFNEAFAHSYVLGGHRYAVDTQRIIDYLINRGDVNREKLGWLGGSTTAILGLGVVSQGPRFAAFVGFVGTGAYEQWLATWHTNKLWVGKTNDLWPETTELLKYDPIRHVDKLYPTAVLMVNGGEDKVVDPAPARAFVKAAVPFYKEDPERLRLVVYENFSHGLPLDAMKMYAEHWFRRYMHPTDPAPEPAVRPKVGAPAGKAETGAVKEERKDQDAGKP